jgi:hypothetical protein
VLLVEKRVSENFKRGYFLVDAVECRVKMTGGVAIPFGGH